MELSTILLLVLVVALREPLLDLAKELLSIVVKSAEDLVVGAINLALRMVSNVKTTVKALIS
jgi:hypothetical protein